MADPYENHVAAEMKKATNPKKSLDAAALAAQPAPASVGADAEALKRGDRVVWTSCYGIQFPGEVVEQFTAYKVKLDDGTVGEYCRAKDLYRLAGTGSGIRIVESNAITDGDALIVQDGRPVAKITGLAGTGGE